MSSVSNKTISHPQAETIIETASSRSFSDGTEIQSVICFADGLWTFALSQKLHLMCNPQYAHNTVGQAFAIKNACTFKLYFQFASSFSMSTRIFQLILLIIPTTVAKHPSSLRAQGKEGGKDWEIWRKLQHLFYACFLVLTLSSNMHPRKLWNLRQEPQTYIQE